MGRFQPGQVKPIGSGRKRGTQNKNTRHLLNVLDNLNFNTAEQLVALLPKLKPEKRADVLMGLMSYQYPKPKPAERQPEGPVRAVIVSIPPNGREYQAPKKSDC